MKRTIFTALTIMLLTFVAFSQMNFCDSIYFEPGKSKISSASTKILSKFLEMAKGMKLYDITLTAYIEKSSSQDPQKSLAKNRFQGVCKYLISQNMGTHIREIEIVTVGSKENKTFGFGRVRNRIDVTIQEKLPDKEEKVENPIKTTTITFEPDTVITSTKGTRLKIKGGTFFPLKISDYIIEIKELFTTEDFINNNVSTTTSDRQVIKPASAIRILATPKNMSFPVPVKLQKPAIILIPVADSLTSEKLVLFYQANDSKSFITWKKTRDTTVLKYYEGNKFYMVNVAQLGWVMVGMLLAICNCRITTPQFQEQRLNIVYPDLGSVIFLDGNHETLFNIPCAEGERRLKTFIKALDHSGQMFSLEKTFSDPVLKNENIGIYKIKKDDYIKL